MTSVLLSFGVLFIEDAFNFLIQQTVYFQRALMISLTAKKPSIVRKIGSHCKWIKAHQLYIVWREGFNEVASSVCEDNILLKTHCHCLDHSNNKSEQLENKVEELEKELSHLQSQVSQLLLAQEKGTVCIDEKRFKRTDLLDNMVSSSTSLMPPPPPPPLPPTPLLTNKVMTVLVKVKPKDVSVVNGRDSVCSIIEELSKKPPKLRHVELSPGGRPRRSYSFNSTHPADVLTAALKKRFEAIHSPKRELFPPSPTLSPSSPIMCGQ